MRRARQHVRNYLGRLIGIQCDMQIWWTPEIPVIYVGNPKAGCSTIKQSLKIVQAGAYTRAGRAFDRVANPHADDDCLRRSGLKPASSRNRYLFSCVRNPYVRALSAYLEKVESRDLQPYPELRQLKSPSFEAFLHALASRRPSHLDVHFRPQHINLNYPSLAYDAIFFLEAPDAAGGVLEKIIPDFKLERFAPHAQGAAQKLAAHYNASTLAMAGQIYARDFEVFGYSRDLGQAAVAPGAMIAGRQLLAVGAGQLPLAATPRATRDTRTLENTLRCRWLIERHII